MNRYYCVILLFLIFSVTNAYPNNWQTYTIPGGNFTIQFPGEPEQNTQEVATAFGNVEMKMLMYSVEDFYCAVAFADLLQLPRTKTEVDSFFNNAIKGMVHKANGQLVFKQPITYDNYPGREIKLLVMNGTAILRGRLFLAGNRLYQLIAITKSGNNKTEMIEKFWDSFTIDYDTGVPFIERLLKEIGYTYELADDGEFQLTLLYEDQRSQLVHIYPFVSETTKKVAYDVWSTVAAYQEMLPDTIYQKLLIKNGESNNGRFQAFAIDSGYVLVYSAVLSESFDAAILKKVILDVAGIADVFEQMITNKDDY